MGKSLNTAEKTDGEEGFKSHKSEQETPFEFFLTATFLAFVHHRQILTKKPTM